VRSFPGIPFVLALAACTGAPPTDSRADDEEDTSAEVEPVDTSDTAVDETPVWTNFRVETSSTLQGVYASGQGVYVTGTEGRAYVGGASTPWVAMDPPVDGVNLTDLWGTGAAESEWPSLRMRSPGAAPASAVHPADAYAKPP
jgi:hypothetical protein